MNSRFLRFVPGRMAGLHAPGLESLGADDVSLLTKQGSGVKPFEGAAEPAVALVGGGELTLREEAIFLLHTAAEVEHSLLVQYLYAATSLQRNAELLTGTQIPANAGTLVSGWFREIFQIAQEEMGHLLTVLNVLRLLGGPLNLEREDFPFRTGLYPYSFELEPLTLITLAKYVVAEMPAIPPPGTEALVADARSQLRLDDLHVDRVGALYKRLVEVIQSLEPEDFNTGPRVGREHPLSGCAMGRISLLSSVRGKPMRYLLYKLSLTKGKDRKCQR
jgi:hypothetical protein